jgi:hypothetical protein
MFFNAHSLFGGLGGLDLREEGATVDLLDVHVLCVLVERGEG